MKKILKDYLFWQYVVLAVLLFLSGLLVGRILGLGYS